MITPGRITRAVEAVTEGRVESVEPGVYNVSSYHFENSYMVEATEERQVCQCAWGENSPNDWSDPCYHALAVAMYAEIEVPDLGQYEGEET